MDNGRRSTGIKPFAIVCLLLGVLLGPSISSADTRSGWAASQASDGLDQTLAARVRRTAEPLVIENSGTACFSRGETASGIHVEFIPAAPCLSTSCTERIEQTLNMRLEDHGSRPAIHLTSRFVLRPRPEMQICTADCAGGGRAQVVLEAVPDGTYTVFLGDYEIGQLSTAVLKPGFRDPVCLYRLQK